MLKYSNKFPEHLSQRIKWISSITAVLILAVSSCQQAASTTTPVATILEPIGAASTSERAIMESSATTSALPLPSPAPTDSPITRGPELITRFQVYDDFSQPFNLDDWVAIDERRLDIFEFHNKYNILHVSMDETIQGDVNLFLEIPPQNLPEDVNSIAVSVPVLEEEIVESSGGVQISLTDGETADSLFCGILQHAGEPEFICELFEQNGAKADRNLVSLNVPKYQLQDICISWIPETGHVLIFLNNQLVGTHWMEATAQVHSLQAGIFVNRYNHNDGGTFQFTNFRVGTARESNLTAPEYLLPEYNPSLTYSTHTIDYYLVDDFNNPALDGLGNYSIWNLDVPDGIQGLPTSTIDYRQQDGALHISGSGTLVMNLLQTPAKLRALEVEVQFMGESPDESFVELQLAASGPDKIYLNYYCRLNYRSGAFGNLFCHTIDENGQFLYVAEEIPFKAEKSVIYSIAFDEVQYQFETRLDGLLVNHVPLEHSHIDIINRLDLSPRLAVISTDSQAITIDNTLYGLQRDVTTLPVQDPREYTAALPHSDLFMYDDFSNRVLDTIWDTGRWIHISTSAPMMFQGMYQQDGSLIVKRVDETRETGAWKLTASEFDVATPDQVNAIQVQFHGEPDHRYEGNTGFLVNLVSVEDRSSGQLGTGQTLPNGSGYGCNVYYLHDFAHIGCGANGFPGSEGSDTGRVRIDATQAHQLALEYVSTETTFYAYFDEVLFNQFTIQGHQLDHFLFDIRAQIDAGIESGDLMYIDQVQIGIPADHPELFETPEASYETFDPHAEP